MMSFDDVRLYRYWRRHEDLHDRHLMDAEEDLLTRPNDSQIFVKMTADNIDDRQYHAPRRVGLGLS